MMLAFETENSTLEVTKAGKDVRLRVANKATGNRTVFYLNVIEAKTLATALTETAKAVR